MKWQDVRSNIDLNVFLNEFQELDAHDKLMITAEMVEFLDKHVEFLKEVSHRERAAHRIEKAKNSPHRHSMRTRRIPR